MLRPRRYFADISSNNGTGIDLGAYAHAGHALIAIKATEGETYVNPLHHGQCIEAHRHGLTVAHYHFCRPESMNVAAELRSFRQEYLRGWRKGDYVVLDLEVGLGRLSAHDMQVYARSFIGELYRHTGHPAILYTYQSFRSTMLAGLQFKGNRWWIADYDSEKPAGATWAWQYTDGSNGPEPHHFDGIGVTSDGSILNRPLALRLAVRKQRTGRR